MRVGYLGPEGTVSHDALSASPGAVEFEPVPQPTLHAAVLAVHEGTVDRALVPIENALEGSVNPTLDALVFETEDVAIVGELRHPVHFCLIAATPLELADVRTVLSIPQASGQCARFLRESLAHARVVTAPSTADAVRQVAGGVEAAAALGTRVRLPRLSGTPRLHLRDGVVSVLLATPEPVLLSELRSSGFLLKKIAGTSTDVTTVTVGAAPGLWIAGARHVLVLPPAPPRLAGNVRVWDAGAITYRLEGRGLTREHALRLAAEIDGT
jgi:hypothetical protein